MHIIIQEQIKFKPTKKKQKSIGESLHCLSYPISDMLHLSATSNGKSDTENESCETEGHSVEKDVRQPSTAYLNHSIIIIYNRDQPDQGRGFGVVCSTIIITILSAYLLFG